MYQPMYSVKTVSLVVLVVELSEATGLSRKVASNLVTDIAGESMWQGMPVYVVGIPGNHYPFHVMWGNEASDIIDAVYNCHWEKFPGAELQPIPGTGIIPLNVHISERDADFIREKVLQKPVNRENHQALPVEPRQSISQLTGPTVEKLLKIIRDFPEKYPNHSISKPKLNTDVKPWMTANYGVNAREKDVFGAIIREHFKLSDDTQG